MPLRRFIKGSASRSARAGRGHGSDQGEVWKEVGRQMEALGASSPTAAMADTFAAYRHRLAELRKRLTHVDGASGFASRSFGLLYSSPQKKTARRGGSRRRS